MVWEWGAYLGAEALEQGVDMKVSSWSRMAPNTLPAIAKATANYANSALIKMEALADGYSEGIALDVYGHVSEGSGQNIFIVRDGTLLHAAAQRVDPRRHHARLDHHARARARLHRHRNQPAARGALHRRRSVRRRHRGRSDAGPLDRQDHHRPRPSRPGHHQAADGVLRRHQRQRAGHARLAHLRLPEEARSSIVRAASGGGNESIRP